jgi:hypothetical protein
VPRWPLLLGTALYGLKVARTVARSSETPRRRGRPSPLQVLNEFRNSFDVSGELLGRVAPQNDLRFVRHTHRPLSSKEKRACDVSQTLYKYFPMTVTQNASLGWVNGDG